jgi:hypothetical protein
VAPTVFPLRVMLERRIIGLLTHPIRENAMAGPAVCFFARARRRRPP